jgi:hypothetical protein
MRKTLPDAERFVQADAKTILWRSAGSFSLDVAEIEQTVKIANEA